MVGWSAGGEAGPDSDVDLLVILPFEGKAFWKSLEIMNRLDVRFGVDLLLRRPEEVSLRYAQGDPILRDALDHGRLLYERSA